MRLSFPGCGSVGLKGLRASPTAGTALLWDEQERMGRLRSTNSYELWLLREYIVFLEAGRENWQRMTEKEWQ